MNSDREIQDTRSTNRNEPVRIDRRYGVIANRALMIVLCLAFAATAFAQKLSSVTLLENADVTGKEVFLGDIALVESPDVTLQDKIRKVLIGPSAAPGNSVSFHIGYIKSRLRQQGIPPESIAWSGSQSVVVQTKATVISAEQLLSSAEKFVKDFVGETKGAINVQPVNEIKPIMLPYGSVDIKVEPVFSLTKGGQGRDRSSVSLRFIISVDGKTHEKRIIPIKVEVIREVVVSARDIAPREVLDADDLTVAERDAYLCRNVFGKKDDIVGKRAKGLIPRDTIITSDMVEEPPVIKQGDLITIVVESPNLRVTSKGKAKEDGSRGQFIRVINTSSMKEISAQVVDEKTVRVVF